MTGPRIRYVKENCELSSRQLEIMQAMVAGEGPSATARRLGVHVKTISTIRTAAADRLGVDPINHQALREAARAYLESLTDKQVPPPALATSSAVPAAADVSLEPSMTSAEYEARIDAAERLMIQADTRTDRAFFAQQFLAAIHARNAARSPEEIAEIERARGLRA